MTGSGTGVSGRTALVTGAAGGIGREIVAQLRAEGATVVAVDLRELDTTDDGVMAVAVDLTDVDAVRAAVSRVLESVGTIDVLVNAAGVYGDFIRTDRIPTEMWDHYLASNLSAHFYVTQCVLPGMVAQEWGRIVNVASIAATDGGYRQAHYASAKAGLIGLTRSLALEFAALGITCNAVLPGPINTPKVVDSAPASVLDDSLEWVPAHRFGTAAEVAAVVTFLASPEASYVNGASVPVDGATLLLQFRFARKSTPTRTKEGPA